MTSQADNNLLQQWFPGTANPFIANAPMLGFADGQLATAVTNAGGLGQLFCPDHPSSVSYMH